MSQSTSQAAGPHQRIAAPDPRDRFALMLFDRLWDEYRRRVSYVQQYEQVIQQHGGTFVNDHIAFRTIATQSPASGIHSLSRIFVALGYRAAGTYFFDDKHLAAIHYQHANPEFPKLFISELLTWELDDPARQIITSALKGHREPISDDELAALYDVADEAASAKLLDRLTDWFIRLPWAAPAKDALTALNKFTQYGAWVLVHGYNVNHFTSLINSHGIEALDNIEKSIAALQAAGVPMKSEIEGEPGSKLRQTATEAVMIQVPVIEGGRPTTISWSYAYFELAQRDWLTDPVTGQRTRFEGFLGPQATNLFEMTRVK